MKHLLSLLLLSLLVTLHAANLDEIALFPIDFQGGKYAFNENHISPVRISFRGNGYELAKAAKTELVLQMPEFLELVAAHSIHPLNAEMLPITTEANITRMTLPEKYQKLNIRPSFPWACGLNLYFRAKQGTAGQRGIIVFSIETDGKAEELTKTIHVTAAEQLPVVYRKLKKFAFGNWYLHAMTSPDRSLFDLNVQFWKNFYDHPICSLGGADFAIKDKTRVTQLLKDFTTLYVIYSSLDTIVPTDVPQYGFYDGGKITRPNVPRLIDANGNVRNNLSICPQYLINDPENVYWDKNIVEGVQKILDKAPGLKGICLDYESHPEDGTCDDCRAEFARQENLPQVPSREDIKSGKPLHIKWRKFRERQRTQIIKRYYETLKKNFPDLKQWMCTVSLVPNQDPIMAWSGIDPRSYSPYTDYFNNMLYCAGKPYADMLERSLKELDKPLYPLIDPAETEIRWFLRYTPDTVRQNILITAAKGCKGMSLYPADFYDASYLTMLCDAVNAVAEAEDAFERPEITGKLRMEVANVITLDISDGDKTQSISYPDMANDLRTFLHHDGKNFYATLFNYSPTSDAFCRLSLPDYQGDGTVVDLVSRVKYTGITDDDIRKGFLVKLPTNGSLLLKFGPYEHLRGELPQANLQKALAAFKQSLTEKSTFMKTQTKGNSSIQWVIGKSGKLAIQLKDCNSYIQFDPENGGLISDWRIPGIGQCVSIKPNEEYGLGELFFHDPNPSIPHSIPFKLESLHFNDARPTATMSYTVLPDLDAGGSGNPLENLKIVRENTIGDSLGSNTVKHTFINQSQKPMTFGIRMRSIPINRWKPESGPQALLADGTEIPRGTRTYIKPNAHIEWP
ncbi:MAG: hypothetical protein J6X55_07760 [Victivallales bacterium]|nr:hypothetical protein [Victivallales bacterium]